MEKDNLQAIKEYLCSRNPILNTDEAVAIMDTVIAVIEKQTPKKPIGKYAYRQWYREELIRDGEYGEADKLDYYCPSCGGVLDTFLGGDAYCRKCGQKIDWTRRTKNEHIDERTEPRKD